MNPLTSIIATILAGQTSLSRMFTAYDITLLVRATGENVKHAQVQSIVHDLMQNTNTGYGYTRTLKTFGLQAFPAFVYYNPSNSNPDDYDPNMIKNACAKVASPGITSAASQPVVTMPSPATSITSGGKKVNLGAGNRLRVPAESIRALGLKSGDKAFVSFNGATIEVSAAQPVGKSAKSYTVDGYDNLLFRVQNPSSQTFTVGQSGSKIVLSAN